MRAPDAPTHGSLNRKYSPMPRTTRGGCRVRAAAACLCLLTLFSAHAAAASAGREIYNYLGRADYWVYSERWEVQTYQTADDVIRDKFVATPLIRDLETLQARLSDPTSRKWLIVSDAMLKRTSAISPAIKEYIAGLGGQVAYTGLDGSTRVYLIE